MQWFRSGGSLAILLAGCVGGVSVANKEGGDPLEQVDGGDPLDGDTNGDGTADGSPDGSPDGDPDGDPDGSGDGDPQVIPPPKVTACDALQAKGVWENITPPVTVLPHAAPCPYGGAIAVNPQDPAMLYAGTCNQGIWKTSDCGATWVHINTGENGTVLDSGRQWTFEIDPIDPNVMYTNSGYGAMSQGMFKSTNGGVDWEKLWPPADPALSNIVANNFVGTIALDPSDHTHLLLTFHDACNAPHAAACFAESEDSGATWTIVDGRSEWVGGEGQGIYFLDGRKTWLWGSQSNGLWRTEDGGDNWTSITSMDAQGHGLGQMYRAANGVFYLPVTPGIIRSEDGITWTLVPNSGDIMKGLIGNGTTMWASRGFPWDPSTNLYRPFWSSAENDGLTWTRMESPELSNGGKLQYSPVHKLLYSSNLGAGVWRVVVE